MSVRVRVGKASKSKEKRISLLEGRLGATMEVGGRDMDLEDCGGVTNKYSIHLFRMSLVMTKWLLSTSR